MASSMRPLYSAALVLSEFSAFFGAAFSGAISAVLDSTGFAAAAVPAGTDAVSFGCDEVSVPAGFADELFGAASEFAGTEAGTLPPLFCASYSSRAAWNTGFILFAP